ncbi:EAL domain-containing response regulator [Oceanobacter mangrovi]|uniref:EAL domain-containing response regulator n=1 Tax=Oceanobacter mangrovi TaxID=2862510 RepID=UPI001C8D0EA4|nr:EAL domain-containing protein [Oceanobacter mangrovi]
MPTRANILVVDDNPANVQLLMDMLEDEGYLNVHGCTDPREVLGLAQQVPRDLMLLDIRMPQLSGHDVLEQLARHLGDKAPAVIVLSAENDLASRIRALELGAQDYLTKPFEQKEVLKRIDNLLRLQHRMNWQTSRAEHMEQLVEQRTEELERLSVEDPLTGLPNRRALSNALADAGRLQQALTVLFITLDGFDELARLNGYSIADVATLAVRDRLRRMLPGRALAGVWNGYEWAVLLHDYQLATSEILAAQLIEGLSKPFEVAGIRFNMRLSIGMADTCQTRDVEQLIRMAALAVPASPNSLGVYSQALEDAFKQRNQKREALQHALDRKELFLLYQPKINAVSGRVESAEALLRWHSRDIGFVPPDEFIPLAEASGDILAIGDWVIDESIRQLLEWRQTAVVPADFRVAINVSAAQLQQVDFASRLIARLAHAGLADAIEVEVTETGLMQDIELAFQQLSELAGHGIRVAIDDFGTGYSSLSYLKNLPISVLKIDRAFVRDMDTNPQDLNLVNTVIQMASCFGFATVAEGVEREEHVLLLRDMRCDVL